MTEPEVILWDRLRRGQLGCRFRRQHPIGPFVVDFVCLRHRLVIECDGEQHFESPYDAARDRWLHEHGYTVLRFGNEIIWGRIDEVLDTIVAHCHR